MDRTEILLGWIFDHIFWLIGATIAIVLVVPIAYTVAAYQNDRWITCTVEDKDRTSSDGSSDMRVYTTECGNLKVQDATFAKNFHSSDTYREIEVGQTYRMHVNGFRIPFLSEFPNILEVQSVQ